MSESVEELQRKVAEYEGQLKDVDSLLALEPANAEFVKLRSDLEAVIKLTQDLIGVQAQAEAQAQAQAGDEKNEKNATATAEEAAVQAAGARAALLEEDLGGEQEPSANVNATVSRSGDRVEAQFDGLWYPADVSATSVVKNSLEYDVVLVVDESRHRVPAARVRPLAAPRTGAFALEQVQEGLTCQCKYFGDGFWHDAAVRAVDAGRRVVTVAYTKFKDTDVVPLEYLRSLEAAEAEAEAARRRANVEKVVVGGRQMFLKVGKDGMFEVPEDLEILETDTEAERQRKKKQVKKIKYQNRLREQEKDRNQKQNSWQSFSKKNSKRKSGSAAARRKKESIFATSGVGKVGVTGSGKGMTNFEQRKRYKLN